MLKKLGYVLVIAWVAFTFILIGWVFVASFSTTNEIFSNSIFSFKSGLHFSNYVRAWTTQRLSVFFMNSILYTVVSITAILIVASPASYVLSRFSFRGNTIIQNMFAAALGIPVIMIIMPLFSLAASFKLIGNRWILMLLYIGMNVPFSVFFLYAFFKNLSTSYEESAAIDGCSQFRTFWMIMFPLVQPGLITLTVFNFVTIWNEFFVALIFANQPAVRPVSVGIFNVYQSMRYSGDWAGMFAGLVIILLPTIVLYIFLSDKIIKGVTAGAIKG